MKDIIEKISYLLVAIALGEVMIGIPILIVFNNPSTIILGMLCFLANMIALVLLCLLALINKFFSAKSIEYVDKTYSETNHAIVTGFYNKK